MSKSSSLRIWEKLERVKNENAFFDGFKRRNQKVRLEGKFPSIDEIIALGIKKDLFAEIYGGIPSCKPLISLNDMIINKIIDEKLELSISIDGQGRKEFIKMNMNPKQKEDEEENKDVIDKIADAIG